MDDRLARLLDSPQLATLVPGLPPETLHRLIKHRGLDSCGELVAAATPEQLTAVLDMDLWHQPRAGLDDHLDHDRFGDWLEMLHETGDLVAARIIASFSPDLVIGGLAGYVRVVDAGALTIGIDGEAWLEPDKFSPSGLTQAVGGYVIEAIRPDAWDAIVALLVELEEQDRKYFHAVMQGCRRLSNATPEVDGLDDLLMAPEQQLHDIAASRSHRRARHGYATPADARAFLKMARQPGRRPPGAARSMNPLVAAYFRAAQDAEEDQKHEREDSAVQRPVSGDQQWTEAVTALLADADLLASRPRALLEGDVSQPERPMLIRSLLERAQEADDAIFATRSQELAFLANVLVAGCSIQSRPFTPAEASEAAVATCNLGLEQGPAPPDTFLLDHDLITAFEAGWAVLHEQVSMFVATRLIADLADVRSVDLHVADGLKTLQRELARQCEIGTPWAARGALDVMTMLDVTVWASLQGLLDECPVLPAALAATMEGRTGRVSATKFEFISTNSQIRDVHAFAANIVDLLMR